MPSLTSTVTVRLDRRTADLLEDVLRGIVRPVPVEVDDNTHRCLRDALAHRDDLGLVTVQMAVDRVLIAIAEAKRG